MIGVTRSFLRSPFHQLLIELILFNTSLHIDHQTLCNTGMIPLLVANLTAPSLSVRIGAVDTLLFLLDGLNSIAGYFRDTAIHTQLASLLQSTLDLYSRSLTSPSSTISLPSISSASASVPPSLAPFSSSPNSEPVGRFRATDTARHLLRRTLEFTAFLFKQNVLVVAAPSTFLHSSSHPIPQEPIPSSWTSSSSSPPSSPSAAFPQFVDPDNLSRPYFPGQPLIPLVMSTMPLIRDYSCFHSAISILNTIHVYTQHFTQVCTLPFVFPSSPLFVFVFDSSSHLVRLFARPPSYILSVRLPSRPPT